MAEPTPNEGTPTPAAPGAPATPAPAQDGTPARPEGASADAPQTYPVTVDGKEMQVTLAEMQKGYNLEASARKKMDDAATQRKELADKVVVADMVERLMSGDANAIGEIAQAYNVPAAQIAEIQQSVSAALTADAAPVAQPPGKAAEPAKPDADLLVEVENFSPAMKQQWQRLLEIADRTEKTELETCKEKMFLDTKNRVDNDEILSKIEDSTRKSQAVKYAQDQVQRRVGLLHEPWPDVLDEIIPETRAIFGHVGNQDALNQDGQAQTAIGPAAAMSAGPVPTEPVKPVPATDPGYRKNVAHRIAQKIQRMRAAQQ